MRPAPANVLADVEVDDSVMVDVLAVRVNPALSTLHTVPVPARVQVLAPIVNARVEVPVLVKSSKVIANPAELNVPLVSVKELRIFVSASPKLTTAVFVSTK